MKTAISFLIFIVLLQTCYGFKKTLPVFMIDHDSIMPHVTLKSNPFQSMHPKSFTELALEAVKHAEFVLIFIEETLCTEDISTRDFIGTPFYNLQKGVQADKVLYIPAVREPYDLLWKIFEPLETNIFRVGSEEQISIKKHSKYGYVYFKQDYEMTRVEKLRKHDTIVKEVYFTVRQAKAGPVVAFYTGKRNPVTMAQLAYSPQTIIEPPKDGTLMVVTPDAMFRFTGVFAASNTRRSMLADTPVVEYEMRTRSSLTTTMFVTDIHLQFNFELEEEEWRLTNVALLDAGQEVGRTDTDISVPWQRSYYCAEPISVVNQRDGSSIVISEYQIEPLPRYRRFEGDFVPADDDMPIFRGGGSTTVSGNGTNGTDKYCYFSKSMNCGPYFNTYILSGLFVSGINLIITFLGIIMIMNCGRNDRFEEPNVRPLIAPEVGPGI